MFSSSPQSSPDSQPVQAFFTEFYKTSDTPDAHEKYADAFTEDATFILASKTAKGRAEILALRKAMWEHIAGRSHQPAKLFLLGAGPLANEVMLYGTVAYKRKNNSENEVDWAARAHLIRGEDGVIKMDFYQVYLDTAAQSASR
ncbi:hypothetical protein MMC20_000623 [Loxospora ochrophaea]|nr:hypothetical protein [Loxospora ochrophaea]